MLSLKWTWDLPVTLQLKLPLWKYCCGICLYPLPHLGSIVLLVTFGILSVLQWLTAPHLLVHLQNFVLKRKISQTERETISMTLLLVFHHSKAISLTLVICVICKLTVYMYSSFLFYCSPFNCHWINYSSAITPVCVCVCRYVCVCACRYCTIFPCCGPFLQALQCIYRCSILCALSNK